MGWSIVREEKRTVEEDSFKKWPAHLFCSEAAGALFHKDMGTTTPADCAFLARRGLPCQVLKVLSSPSPVSTCCPWLAQLAPLAVPRFGPPTHSATQHWSFGRPTVAGWLAGWQNASHRRAIRHIITLVLVLYNSLVYLLIATPCILCQTRRQAKPPTRKSLDAYLSNVRPLWKRGAAKRPMPGTNICNKHFINDLPSPQLRTTAFRLEITMYNSTIITGVIIPPTALKQTLQNNHQSAGCG